VARLDRRDPDVKALLPKVERGARLGAKGQAVYIDGPLAWAFPTPTRADYDNPVWALVRTPGKNRATVRRYLTGRARQEG
jgi:hypothetical protein